MSFLNEFFLNVFQQSPAYQDYAAAQAEQHLRSIEAHLEDLESDFVWTDAVRPSDMESLQGRQGYRHDVYRDDETGKEIPVIMAAASAEVVFPLFMQLVEQLGPTVDVVLESSHEQGHAGHVDFYREQIDSPVLNSALWEFEEMLTNDGCTGIAVLNPETPQEVQLDEHKVIIIYGSPLESFERILAEYDVHPVDDIAFVTETEHVHTSTRSFYEQFLQARTQLGIDEDFSDAEPMC